MVFAGGGGAEQVLVGVSWGRFFCSMTVGGFCIGPGVFGNGVFG